MEREGEGGGNEKRQRETERDDERRYLCVCANHSVLPLSSADSNALGWTVWDEVDSLYPLLHLSLSLSLSLSLFLFVSGSELRVVLTICSGTAV